MRGEQIEHDNNAATRCHRLTWPDGLILDVVNPQRDAFRRLKADVSVWSPGGKELLNRSMVDLLSETDRARFHQNTQAKVAWLSGDGEGLKDINIFERLLQALNIIDPPRSVGDDEIAADIQSDEASNPWQHAKSAPSWLSEPEVAFQGLAKDLIAPGAITLLASPRGLGKTQVSHAVAVALATGGQFRSEHVKPVRVLLLDRDNPDTIVKRRLRAWGAIEAKNLHVLTRQNAPALQDKAAWAHFPLDHYDVLIVDSVGSSTEGITEKEGKQTTEVLATILDLARKGLAILLLQNVTKDGVNFKGRGEWADRVDILYEIRDATSFTPSGRKPWWQELPAAGEAAWAERAARRKGRVDYRLAFIPSKFRLGVEPDPFCLELHLPPEAPWTLDDVSEQLFTAGEEARAETEDAKRRRVQHAAQALSDAVSERALTNHHMLKTEAENFLRGEEFTRREARQTIDEHDGRLWKVEGLPGKGAPQALFPVEGTDSKSFGGENTMHDKTVAGKDSATAISAALAGSPGANGTPANQPQQLAPGSSIFAAEPSEKQLWEEL